MTEKEKELEEKIKKLENKLEEHEEKPVYVKNIFVWLTAILGIIFIIIIICQAYC